MESLMTNSTIMYSEGASVAPFLSNLTSKAGETQQSEDLHCTSFTFILYVPIFGSLCLFGIVGNFLSIIVLQFEKQNYAATFLLQALALTDNCFLFTTGFVQIYSASCLYFDTRSNPQAYIQILLWPLVHITQMLTIWMTLLIALNRYIAICKPFQAPLLCTMKKVRMQVILVIFFTLIYNLPRWFEYRIIESWDPVINSTLKRIDPTSLKLNNIYNLVYESALYCLFVFLGPLVILIVLNVCLIRELWAARQRLIARQIPIVGEEEEQNLTLVMIVIMLLFVVCQTPACINQLLYYLDPNGYACGNAYYYYFHISNIVVSTNSSINFVVYCVFRQQFRERLKKFCNQRHSVLKHVDTYLYNGKTANVYTRNSSATEATIINLHDHK